MRCARNWGDNRMTWKDCQQKTDNNLKINYNFMLAKPTNPLFPSISRNHKQGTNLMASVNFQPMRQVNRQGTKHPSVKIFPIR
jgi:hypothetical protein